jgi:hypothetical protein
MAPPPSGSTAVTTPDFCPATSARFPFARLTRIADEPKSKSGPLAAGQFGPLAGHATLKASPDVICREIQLRLKLSAY